LPLNSLVFSSNFCSSFHCSFLPHLFFSFSKTGSHYVTQAGLKLMDGIFVCNIIMKMRIRFFLVYIIIKSNVFILKLCKFIRDKIMTAMYLTERGSILI
jgi:hypothetical protein